MNQNPDEFLALLAHELRTPISAIIGYQDLMSEGILGEMDPRIAESLERVRSSANQLLTLVAGLGEATVEDAARLYVNLAITDMHALLSDVLAELLPEAAARGTTITVTGPADGPHLLTDPERVERALTLMIHAAIKASAGAAVLVDATFAADQFQCTLTAARLDLEPDDFSHGVLAVSSAAALRLAMASQAIRPLMGTISLRHQQDQSVVTITVPRLPDPD